MNAEFEYDHNAAQLDRQLEEVMDSHRTEVAETQAKEAEALSVEPPALDRLMSTTKDAVDEVKGRGKKASVVLQEEMVRDRLQELQASGPNLVDGFLKEAGIASKLLQGVAGGRVAARSVGLAGKATKVTGMGRASRTVAPREAGRRAGLAAATQVNKGIGQAKRVASTVSKKLVKGPVGKATRAVGRIPGFQKMRGAIKGIGGRGFTGR